MRKSIFLISCILLSLCPAAIPQTIKPAKKVVTAAQVNGTWRFQRNTFKVLALGNQKLQVEFLGIYEYKTPSGRMANTGEASGIAMIEGETALFRPDDTDEKCKITMRFTSGKLIVEQEDVCGFGNNVTAAGAYRKVNSSKPKFDKK